MSFEFFDKKISSSYFVPLEQKGEEKSKHQDEKFTSIVKSLESSSQERLIKLENSTIDLPQIKPIVVTNDLDQSVNNTATETILESSVKPVKSCHQDSEKEFNSPETLERHSGFHRNCSEKRAGFLLHFAVEGTYLLRKEEIYILSYVEDNMICHMPINFEDESINKLKKFINEGIPYENVPLDHACAQLEWNCNYQAIKENLQKLEPGECFISRDSSGMYALYAMDDSHSIFKCELKVQDNTIYYLSEDQWQKINNIYELITERLQLHTILNEHNYDIMELLYYQKLLPMMLESGSEWEKASRKTYPQLPRSIWYNTFGGIYEQYHNKSFTTIDKLHVPSEDKHFRGKGGYKRVFDLQNFYNDAEKLVRATDNPDANPLMLKQISKRNHRITQMMKEVDCTYLLAPNFVSREIQDGKFLKQVMPLIEFDLVDTLQENKLTLKNRLQIMRDICCGLIELHSRRWVHLDVKPDNIMFDNLDNPHAKLMDFDFLMKFTDDNTLQRIAAGTTSYADPLVVTQILGMDIPGYEVTTFKFEQAKLFDQFSFGISLFAIITKSLLREEEYDEDIMCTPITMEEINYHFEKNRILEPRLQDIIIKCCVGPLESRSYCMEQNLVLLNELLIELEIIKNQLKKVS